MSKGLPKNGEIFISLFVIAIALLLLVPLPTFVLDLLLVSNLAIAFFLLLVVLYLPNAVQLLAFPTLLLLTTLFRLGLNVASTRLILSQGDAGQVIEAFGTFLVGGELLVGVVVFAIITIINLIVIARGASRISEVAARFALDSLPGKQMSIDADLRAGLLSPQEAERKREQLRKESQLYGAMDGAMKFVQGDAIAGVIIIFANVVGGLSLGLYHGMPLQEAVLTYTMLTVGDGLVSQIPAFLIAICAGLVVTRISTGTEETLGSELREQLFGQPAVLLVVAGLLFTLALIEGMPRLPFILIGLVCIVMWLGLRRKPIFSAIPRGGTRQSLIANEQAPLQLGYEKRFTLAIGVERLDIDPQRLEERLHAQWRVISTEGQFYFGLAMPVPQVELDPMLGAGEYELRKGPQTLVRYTHPVGAVFTPLHPAHATSLGMTVVQEDSTPVYGGRGVWIRGDAIHIKQMLSCFGVFSFEWFEFVGLQFFDYCRRNPEEVMTMSWLHAQVKELENVQPGLVSDGLQPFDMTVSRLLNVLYQLLKEGLPFVGLHRLIEDVSTYYSSAGGGGDEDGTDFDMADLTSFLRQRNREHLLGFQRVEQGLFRIIRLSSGVERLLLTGGGRLLGGGVHLSRGDYQLLRESLEGLLGRMRGQGVLPVAIQCPDVLRVPLFHFLHSLPFTVPMICEEEVDLKTPKVILSEWVIV